MYMCMYTYMDSAYIFIPCPRTIASWIRPPRLSDTDPGLGLSSIIFSLVFQCSRPQNSAFWIRPPLLSDAHPGLWSLLKTFFLSVRRLSDIDLEPGSFSKAC